MNILHMKYAVEVADAGSINKAAEALYIAQPNLSRCIKSLEAELGIAIFDRSSKGMGLTPEGEEFIGYAKNILSRIDDVEKMYKEGKLAKQKFSISVPRSSYISHAFQKFTENLSEDPVEIFYKETNSSRAIKNILTADYKLGIIRYAINYDPYFKASLEEKNLEGGVIAEFHYVLLTHKDSDLAKLETVHFSDLTSKIEIAHADPYVPSLSLSQVRKEELPSDIPRVIYVFERASQYEVLSSNPDTFMWVSPVPQETLDRYGLVMIDCPDNTKIYKDVLIHHKDYVLTDLDKAFITELSNSKRQCL